MFVTPVIILLLALLVLMVSGHWIVRVLNNITMSFGISEFTAAFLILAMATSVPELFMGIASANQEAGEIVLALALGSNVVNITLIIALAALFSTGIKISGKRLKKNIALSIIISILPLLFLIDGVITRFEGLLLLLSFLIYLFVLYRNKPKVTMLKKAPRHILKGFSNVGLLLLLLIILLIASDQTVYSAVNLAESINLSPFLIGLFLLAIGTSLPELTTTLQSAWQGKGSMALGNILGSDAADSALVVGVAAVINPLHIPLSPYIIITAIFVLVANLLLGYFAISKQRISMSESIILLSLFILFILAMFLTSAPILLDAHH